MLIVDTEPYEHVKKAMREINAGKCSFWIEHSFSSLSSRLSLSLGKFLPWFVMTFLNVFVLFHNHLSNMAPLCLGNFSDSLTVLVLRSNKINGTIPKTFTKGNYLRILNLNDNQLVGSLPRLLINCWRLEVLDLGNRKISGIFPHWLESLPELWVLILWSNKFHGAIANPITKFSFPNLQIIDLSHNDFHGHLPTKYFIHFKAMMGKNANNGKLKYMG